MTDIWSENFFITQNLLFNKRNFQRPFFSHRPQIITACRLLSVLPSTKVYLFPKSFNSINYDTQYRRCRLLLPIPITINCSNNQPNYAYGRCIGTALDSTVSLTEPEGNIWTMCAAKVVKNCH